MIRGPFHSEAQVVRHLERTATVPGYKKKNIVSQSPAPVAVAHPNIELE